MSKQGSLFNRHKPEPSKTETVKTETVKVEQVSVDFRFEDWAEKLEREFAIKLLPYLDKRYEVEACRKISASMAMLAARRAREASALNDELAPVMCVGCDHTIPSITALHLCATCGKAWRTPGSDDE